MPLSGDRSDTGACQHSSVVNGISFSGARSVAFVALNTKVISFMSFSGARSDTFVLWQSSFVNFMPLSGDRSASSALLLGSVCEPLQARVRSSVNARTGERSVTLSAKNCNSVTTSPSYLGVTLPSKPGLRSFNLAATADTC